MKDRLGRIEKEMKLIREQELADMEDRMTMSIAKQFQFQFTEIKGLLESTLAREREKDEKIKKLEQENARLKSTTF